MTTDVPHDDRPVVAATRSMGGARRLAVHGVMLLLSALSIFPIYWMIVSSLRPDNEIFSTSPWPSSPSFENYVFVLTRIPMLEMLVNTTVVAAATAALQVATGLLAAYALARQGTPVRVLEQASEFREIGAGIQLGPNVFKAFERLGLKDAIMADVHVPSAMEMRDAKAVVWQRIRALKRVTAARAED